MQYKGWVSGRKTLKRGERVVGRTEKKKRKEKRINKNPLPQKITLNKVRQHCQCFYKNSRTRRICSHAAMGRIQNVGLRSTENYVV